MPFAHHCRNLLEGKCVVVVGAGGLDKLNVWSSWKDYGCRVRVPTEYHDTPDNFQNLALLQSAPLQSDWPFHSAAAVIVSSFRSSWWTTSRITRLPPQCTSLCGTTTAISRRTNLTLKTSSRPSGAGFPPSTAAPLGSTVWSS